MATHHQIEQILKERLPEELTSKRNFERWFEPIKRRVQQAAPRVHREVSEALDEAGRKIQEQEGSLRRVWTVTGATADATTLMKSLESIRSKLGRELIDLEREGGLPAGRMSRDQIQKILLSFRDLGRFRVVCDFSLDVKEAKRVLIHRPDQPCISLLGKFPLLDSPKDFIYDLELRNPARGHRAWHLTAVVEGDLKIRIEIQLMTLLQEAWDRRNHPLFEWSREGGELPSELRINDVALAETLHLVDEQASRNWVEFLKIRRNSI